MTDYPLSLPCPTVADYKGTIDYGFNSVTFSHGNSRRRRLAGARVEKYDLSFVFSTAQLWAFQAWANMWGYNWHYMPIVTHYSGFIDPVGAVLHRCRLTSDINIAALNADTFRVKVSIEIDPLSRPLGVVAPSGDWIVGGTPPSPSTGGWYVGGTPSAPSGTGWVSAGTPVVPAA